MDSPLSFGDWLEQRRKALALTRQQLAQRVGCSVSTLRKIESGERRPSLQIAELLANALDVTPAMRPAFMKVARGVLNVERLPAPILQAARLPAAARSGQAAADRLPINPTPLIGRQRELAELGQLLAEPACRLLSLIGPGGIGKTRLAIRAARQAAEAYADGTAFVSLAALTATRYIVPAIAEALEFSFSGQAEPHMQLAHYLSDKHLLLVLDNVEHLLADGAAQLVAGLLEFAPTANLLVTSREVLGLQAEWVYEVQGLPVAADVQAPDGNDGAVELFLQRARRAHVRFAPTPDDHQAILHICQLVEGLPLAVELAAAWVRLLSCAEIAQQIESSPERLGVTGRDVPSRHRSLRAVFDHSWKLLSDAEQQTLARLSVFRGGFTREAAERVAEADLQLLSALMAKSLVQRRRQERYGLHELVRQYAAGQLQAGADALAAARERHGRYFIDQLLQAETALTSDRQASILARLSLDIDNYRSAWEWAVGQQRLKDVLQVAFVLLYFYELRGLLREGEAAFNYAAGRLPGDSVERWAMVTNEGYFARRGGRADKSHALLHESVTQLRRRGDRQVLRFSLRYYGLACLAFGRFAEAQTALKESLVLSQSAERPWEVAVTSIYLGFVDSEAGDLDAAREYLQRGLEIARRLGDPRLIAYSLANLGQIALETGSLHEAWQCFEEGLSLARETGDRYDCGLALVGLGRVALLAGRAEQAQAQLQTGRALFAEIGDLDQLGRTDCCLGELALRCGDLAAAHRCFQAAVALGADKQLPLHFPLALIGLARVRLRASPADPAMRERALGLALLVDQPQRSRQCRLQAQALYEELEPTFAPEQVDVLRRQVPSQTLEAFVAVFSG
jgi:predicted ATPase/DNA-binding XRE family transcriptional regulator